MGRARTDSSPDSPPDSLAAWLRWQESLSPFSIDMGLDRVQKTLQSLSLDVPHGAVFTVAGTNGKGSCVRLLEQLLLDSGHHPGAYTSPHLVRYNERIRIDGVDVSDADLVTACEQVESVRADTPLTYFEFGTLAALLTFSSAGCDTWILEVGMGGRLDAVNAIDPDFSLITTIGLDHEQWLGSTIEAIAAEKAGIIRPGKPVFYGDSPVPAAIHAQAEQCGAVLHGIDRDFGYTSTGDTWSWSGQSGSLSGLARARSMTAAQLRNISMVLAALEQYDSKIIAGQSRVNTLLLETQLPGRFQVIDNGQQWILDVAHNAQAADVLVRQLQTLDPVISTTAVIGMLADKNSGSFISTLAGNIDHCIVARLDDKQSADPEELARQVLEAGIARVTVADSPSGAFGIAREQTVSGGRILVCGSFRIIGPALEWLGLY